MKVKIFSHKSDPDGIGSVILASFAYGKEVSINLSKGVEELNESLKIFIETKEYEQYDQIFITDLCPSVTLLNAIEQNPSLKEKVLIFDHHQSAINSIEHEYSFLHLMEIKENQKCCGTSLFYEYLISKEINPNLQKEFVQTFVELTRLHDTYEWKEKNRIDAYYLQILFQFLGPWGYFYHFEKRMQEEENFQYEEEEKSWIQKQVESNQKEIQDLYDKMLVVKQKGISFGVFLANYEYRNLLADYIKEHNKEIDAMLLIAGDESRFSFRSINPNIDVNEIAETCGGGGHIKAAGGELNKETLQRILKFLN